MCNHVCLLGIYNGFVLSQSESEYYLVTLYFKVMLTIVITENYA